jgi:hypothetical protein
LACSGQLAGTDENMATGPGAMTGNGGTGAMVGPGAGPGASAGSAGTGAQVAPPGGQLPQEVMGEQFSSPSLRRLTTVQYQNSLRDLFGDAITIPSNLEPDAALSGLKAIGASTLALSARATELFETAARDVANQIFNDATKRQALLGCEPSQPSCLETFVTEFGRRAWRRPLAADEVTKYVSLAQSGQAASGDAWQGASLIVSAMLQSPNFLYRVEIGTVDAAQPTRRWLDSFEVASRLSYLLWGSTPDTTLLDIAQGGSLTDPAAIATQAQRLLSDARAQAAIETFFSEYLGLGGLQTAQKLPEAFPAFTPSLRTAMEQETLLTLRTLAFDEDADFRSLLTSHTTFINPELAELYGIQAAGNGMSRTTLPADSPRVGLLGQASLLTMHSHASTSSPTLRGKFVREILLCQSIPAPPPNVDTTLPDTAGAVTMREKLAIHAEGSCAACHSLMDPIGLALENFDGIGSYRETDNGAAIDASGTLDGVAFNDAAGLAQALSQHARFPECVARTLYRYGMGHVEEPGEEPAIASLVTSFSGSGYKLKDLLLATAQLPGFRYVGALD